MPNIRFGPSGNSDIFYEAGYKQSQQAPAWLRSMGLSAYEYSFGRGIRLSEQTASEIGQQAQAHDIAVSVHAPYFINFANPDAQKRQNSTEYILNSARLARFLGAGRIVFHPGSCKEKDRLPAMELVKQSVQSTLTALEDAGLGDIAICPETMGKQGQLGTVAEIMEICMLDARIIPCFDFGHIHVRDQGCLNTIEDFAAVLDQCESAIGKQRAQNMHVHFSRIEFSEKGEKRHWTLADTQFGPDFEPLAQLFAERDYTCRVISESKGTMAQDAAQLMAIYRQYRQKLQV